ncbi:MAG: zinc ribbon domain-containing protein, partial [Nitrososphaeria archaeon]
MLSLSKNVRIAESRKKKGSKRYRVLLARIQKEYEHLANEKIDIVNKIGSYLVNTFLLVSFQNDSVHSWSKRFGRKVQNTGIAKLKTMLNRHKNTYEIGRYYASTQECSNCHNLNKIPLSQRIYVCNYCGFVIDRDLNSGIDSDAKGHKEVMAQGYPPL